MFFASADGARLTDVAGRHYIDFCLSFGPLILGHRDPVVAAAVHDARRRRLVVRRVRAVLARAGRVDHRARAVGRAPAVRVVGHRSRDVGAARRARRDGPLEDPEVRGLLPRPRRRHARAGRQRTRRADGRHRAPAFRPARSAHTLVAPLDDERAIDAAFDAAGDDLAAVIVEPVPANYGLLPQRQAWLAAPRRACRAGRRARSSSTRSSPDFAAA